jgi:acyl carrier protein
VSDDRGLARVRTIVAQIAGPARTPERVDARTPLGENGFWLDSLDLFEVILACEEAFGVRVDADADTLQEALHTVGGLAALIAAAPRAGPAPAPPSGAA